MKKWACIIFLVMMMVSCAYNEGIVMTENPAYIQFTGDPAEVYVIIDEQKIDLSIYGKKLEETRFKLTEGNHKVSIYKNNKLIVSKFVLLENGKITQVMIP